MTAAIVIFTILLASFLFFVISSLLSRMRINLLLVSRRLSVTAALLLLCACNSSYFSVKKAELTALDQCQQTQQAQQLLLEQQQARLDEALVLLQTGLEFQKNQADLNPPVAVDQIAAAVKCPAPPRVTPPPPTNVEALFLDKQLVGERERVLLTTIDVVLRARINTGVTTSQLDARDIQMFERNGEEWVRFTITDPASGSTHELERKRVRYSPASRSEDVPRRPIVEMRIAIGKITQNAEFILLDRNGQPYPMLIGRNVLRDVMLVDVSRSDIAPVVREAKEPEKAAAKEKANP